MLNPTDSPSNPTRFLLPWTLTARVAAAALALSLLLAVPSHLKASAGESEAGGAIHTELTSSHPAADSVVRGTVERVLLTFSTPVQANLSQVVVVSPDDWTVPASRVAHPDAEATDQLVVRFQAPLPDGDYQVEWRASAPDGHVVSGDFTFQVTDAPPEAERPAEVDAPQEPEAADRDREMALEEEAAVLGLVPPGTGQRWLHLLATVLLLGIVAFRYGTLGPLGSDGIFETVRERADAGLQKLGWVGLALLIITLGTRLHGQLSELAGGDGLAWELLGHLLFQTAWGAGWWIHLAVAVLVGVGLVLLGRPGAGERAWSTLIGAAVLLPLIPTLQGHAMGSDIQALTVPAMYLHVAAVGTWLGGLLMLILVGLPAVRKLGGGSGALPPLARMVNAFSRVALPAVVVLVATGAVTSFIQGGGLSGVLGTTWGRTLLLKLSVVAVAFFLGFYNWRKVRPSLPGNPDAGTLRIPATVEAMLGIVVLLITAALVAMPLP